MEETINTGVIYVVTNLVNNKKYVGKANSFVKHVRNPNYKHGYERLCDFIDNYDSSVDFKYDVGLDDEQSINININAHSRTFCNVVNSNYGYQKRNRSYLYLRSRENRGRE